MTKKEWKASYWLQDLFWNEPENCQQDISYLFPHDKINSYKNFQ